MKLQVEQFINIESINAPELFSGIEEAWQLFDRLEHYMDEFDHWGIHSELPSSVTLVNPESIYIGKNVHIDPFVMIKGPCMIHDGAILSHAALVRPYSIIGPGVLVGHASEIKGSILFKEAKMPHFNYVGDSLIGCGVNLGAGVICANVRLDEKDVLQNGQTTGRKKLGAVVGDHSKIACNLVLNPGAIIPSHSNVVTTAQLKILSNS